MPRSVVDVAHGSRRSSPLVVLLVVAGIGSAAISACSSGTSSPPATAPTAATAAVSAAPTPAAPTSAALCSAAADFRTATDAIGDLDAEQVGVEGVRAALQNLETAGRNLVTAAGAQFRPDVENLTTALGSLQNTITSLSDQNSLSSKLGALAASVSEVEVAAAPIVESVQAGCPSVPPTGSTPPS
jgi:hypothetical protein